MEKTFQPFLLIVGDDHIIKINYLPAQVTQIQIEFYTPSFAKAKCKYPQWFYTNPRFQCFQLETRAHKPVSLEGFEEYIQNGELIQFWCEELEEYLDFLKLDLQTLIQMLFEYFSQEKSEDFQDVPTFLGLLIQKDQELMDEEAFEALFDDDDLLGQLEEF